MDLTPYIDRIGRDLLASAEAGGEEARALAERIAAPLESSARLALLDALSAAADEITRELAPGAVELRLRSGDPEFVVSTAPTDAPAPPPEPPPIPDGGDEGALARINLRLPEQLKAGVEQAAARERLSVNAWLVRQVAAVLASEHRLRQPGSRRYGDEFTGWVR